MVRLAKQNDIDQIKKVAAQYTHELGFILRPALEEAVKRGELLYDPHTGSFCHYHTRRDDVTVIYEICVPEAARGRGIGRQMVDMLPTPIQLKCPVDNPSNEFYKKLGFLLFSVEPGKRRELNLWRLENR